MWPSVAAILSFFKELYNDWLIINWYALHVFRIGFIYDKRMLGHECLWVPTFPEAPSRLKAALDRVREYALLDRCSIIAVSYLSNSLFEDKILEEVTGEITR